MKIRKRKSPQQDAMLLIYRLAMCQPTGNIMADKVLDQARLFVRMEKASNDIAKLKGLIK